MCVVCVVCVESCVLWCVVVCCVVVVLCCVVLLLFCCCCVVVLLLCCCVLCVVKRPQVGNDTGVKLRGAAFVASLVKVLGCVFAPQQ